MILADTSIWIDHLRSGDPQLVGLLQDGHVLASPWVTGELTLGHLLRRSEILGLLHNLPKATVATDVEVLILTESQRLFGLGVGYVDAHLLATTLLTPDARLWTRDNDRSSSGSRQRSRPRLLRGKTPLDVPVGVSDRGRAPAVREHAAEVTAREGKTVIPRAVSAVPKDPSVGTHQVRRAWRTRQRQG